jgi:hypothetical protein
MCVPPAPRWGGRVSCVSKERWASQVSHAFCSPLPAPGSASRHLGCAGPGWVAIAAAPQHGQLAGRRGGGGALWRPCAAAPPPPVPPGATLNAPCQRIDMREVARSIPETVQAHRLALATCRAAASALHTRRCPPSRQLAWNRRRHSSEPSGRWCTPCSPAAPPPPAAAAPSTAAAVLPAVHSAFCEGGNPDGLPPLPPAQPAAAAVLAPAPCHEAATAAVPVLAHQLRSGMVRRQAGGWAGRRAGGQAGGPPPASLPPKPAT